MNNNKFIFTIVSAILMGLSQHPINIGWLAWISIIPLLFVYAYINTYKAFFIISYIWGLCYYLTVIFWLAFNIGTTPFFGFVSMFLAVLYCSINSTIIGLILCFIKKHKQNKWYWALPSIWVCVEYIRNMDILSGGPWTAIANTQTDFLILAQNVEITGIYGISFWIILLNVSIYNILIHPYKKSVIITFIIFIIPWVTGLALVPSQTILNNKKLSLASIQPNIHLSEKWKKNYLKRNLQSLITLSMPHIKDKVDLIVWPESATSSYILQNNKNNLEWIQSILNKTKLITGIPYYNDNKGEKEYYNSATLISKESFTDPYHKMILVPMAEHIPLSNFFPKLKKLNIGQANFSSGKKYKLFNVKNINIATMICFESTIPYISAEFVKKGAEILIYLVNDGWYENPPQPQQHAKQSIYRAIENRRPVIRSTNTGISMIIDIKGNIQKDLPLNIKGTISGIVIPSNEITFYTKYGDKFAQINVFISLFLVLGLFFRRK